MRGTLKSRDWESIVQFVEQALSLGDGCVLTLTIQRTPQGDYFVEYATANSGGTTPLAGCEKPQTTSTDHHWTELPGDSGSADWT